jgi:hypothetical protein
MTGGFDLLAVGGEGELLELVGRRLCVQVGRGAELYEIAALDVGDKFLPATSRKSQDVAIRVTRGADRDEFSLDRNFHAGTPITEAAVPPVQHVRSFCRHYVLQLIDQEFPPVVQRC